MKKILLILLCICMLVIGLGWIMLYQDASYVLITYRNWNMEIRLWLLIFIILLLFLILYAFISLIKGIYRLSTWPSRHRLVKIQRFFDQGTYALIEGRWARAQRYFEKSLKRNPHPLLNYLGAAIAAQKQGLNLQRDQYLKQAFTLVPEAEILIGFLQAQLQIEGKEWQQAFATLEKLKKITGAHPYISELIAKMNILSSLYSADTL